MLIGWVLCLWAAPALAQLGWDQSWPDNQSVMQGAEALGRAADAETNTGQRVRIFPRSSVPWQSRWFPSQDGRDYISVSDSGLNIVIDNVGDFRTVDISTDRLVIWTDANSLPTSGGGQRQKNYEFYMEGNIVFRQDDRVIYAERMYYNVRDAYGVILDGELLTPIPGYEGLVRLKAEVLRQVNENRIEGYQGAITTSRLGVPRYWLQSGNFTYETVPSNSPTASVVDPITGQVTSGVTKRVTSRDNRLYLAEWPIFYWPFMTANLDRPSFYLDSLQINNDSVFGTQLLTDWNLYQLLGIQSAPAGTQWTAALDYLSKRGPAIGTDFEYDGNSCFGIPGRSYGFLHAWAIHDTGLDNLGLGRRTLAPEQRDRGRLFGRHRNTMPGGYQLTGEVGLISDRNFLEQYFEEDWDQEKDETTGLEFKRRIENRSWSVSGDVRVNDFFTQTNWLPRADHYWISQPLLSDWFSWTEHSSVGYGQLQTASAPGDAAQAALFDPLAWEADVQGVRATTRHRLDLPLQWGGAKVVPYVGGEAAHWGQNLRGDDQDRLLGQIGLRASIPFSYVDPSVRSVLFNVNGLAHKVVLESEVFWADASSNMTDLPLYDPLDDDAVEFFRRRFFFTTFNGAAGGNTPNAFDERFYALRSGMQRWVTAPSAEIADDLLLGRLAVRQRWQTKRGLPGRQRVVDWVTFDVEAFAYPNADRDNFGQQLGLLNYDFRWHVGDRFTVISDGMADLFTDGLRTFSLGGIVSRPGLGRYVAGIRSIEGPISSSILYGSTSYRLSEKWIINYGSTYDFGSTGNIGQRGQIVRVGESFLVGLGFNYDSSRDNFGVRFSIEPRFMSGRLSRVGGMPIAPVGFSGLE